MRYIEADKVETQVRDWCIINKYFNIHIALYVY